ncbi:MAG: hypothetical protein RLZZ116_1008 [Planctomycetota bacterium]|jgi:hypothetical protein
MESIPDVRIFVLGESGSDRWQVSAVASLEQRTEEAQNFLSESP